MMTNRPERDRHDDWTVNLETATATHRDGWSFRFESDAGNAGVLDGECIAQPDPLTPEHMRDAARSAREAGDAFIEAMRGRH